MNSARTDTWLLPPRGAAALTPGCARAQTPTPAPGTRAANDFKRCFHIHTEGLLLVESAY